MLSRIKAWFGSSGEGTAGPRERLGDYQLGETLGKGAMSEVRKAFQKKSMRTVAIKLITPESRPIVNKIEQQFRHMTEGEACMLFSHPNIIRVFGWGRDAKNEFIVMEYFNGALLRDLLHEGGFNPSQNRMDIFMQMAEALDHIHSKGIVHRDFCPRNILVSADGVVKVFDFGLSVELELAKKTRGNRTGTLAYMAPELIKRQYTDQRCDIYGLGVTMYEMFAGQRPFLGLDNVARLMQLMTAVADPPSSVNPLITPEMDRVILQAIEKDPDKRQTTVREVIDAMAPIVERERKKWNSSPPTPDTSIFKPQDLSA